MSLSVSLAPVLNRYQSLSQQLLLAAEADAQSLLAGDGTLAPSGVATRRQLLPQLTEALRELRRHRELWQRMTPAERAQEPQMGAMLRSAQDALMKIILRDRENEQKMLRAGTVPAAQAGKLQGPPKPNYVANLYRRHGAA